MRQILQSLKNGQTHVAEVPAPRATTGQILVSTSTTLVSAGTERMLVDFGKANLVNKVRQQPDKVKMVLEKVRTDGLIPTMEAVQSKLDQPLALGYSNVGVIVDVGAAVQGFQVGDRVVSNGKHAEVVSVPKNLCAVVPPNVTDEAAAFTVLGAIGLQGVRLANPTLGECVVVTGLGLIGLLTVQMLRAQGCRVLGVDVDPARLEFARTFGAHAVNARTEDVLSVALQFSRGNGVDAVLITASTASSEPVSQAARMCRKRGRIVLVGVTGLELSRADFYEKELSFQVSCSYGPGRYDPSYEEQGQDYPVGYVRWTEQRNFEAVLDLLSNGSINVHPLITHRYSIEDAAQAYELLGSGAPSLGILLTYSRSGADVSGGASLLSREVLINQGTLAKGSGSLGFLGAGNYAGRVLIPAFQKAGASLGSVVSSSGVSAVHFGRKFSFKKAGTDSSSIFTDSSLDAVVIATRHDAHARQVVASLSAGKHVFCEKPLCLTLDELATIEAAAVARPAQMLMVGFNRRFAPHVVRMKELLGTVHEAKAVIVTVNAGEIPASHWTQDRNVGGGRIVGEACHFIDLARHLVGKRICRQEVAAVGLRSDQRHPSDKVTLVLHFEDGSVATIHYLANGHKGFPKERVEVLCGGRVLQLDNFRKLQGWGWKGFSKMNLWRQDKGQAACAAAFVNAIRSGNPSPIPLNEIIEVSRAAIEAAEMAEGRHAD